MYRHCACFKYLNIVFFGGVDLDMILTPVGSVTKEVGQSVNVTLSKASSADLAVTWKKVGGCYCSRFWFL